MTKRDYIELATALAAGYNQIEDAQERRGYNHCIHAVIQFSTAHNPKFDALRFAQAVYQTQKHTKKTKQDKKLETYIERYYNEDETI